MKKTLLVLAIFTIPIVSFASIDQNLKYGARGQEVTELQEFLIDKGFLSTQATGNFYSLTQKATIAYQTSVGLPATGYVGPLTRGKINEELLANTDVSNQDEITETGTTSTPLVTTATSVIQAQIDALLKQVQNLVDQQKTAVIAQNNQIASTLQTNQSLAQIVQNTTPTPIVVGTVPDPVVVVATPVVVPQPIPIIPPLVAKLDSSPSVPTTPNTLTIGTKTFPNGLGRDFIVYGLRQPPYDPNNKHGVIWGDIHYTIQSNDFSSSDIKLACGDSNIFITLDNYNVGNNVTSFSCRNDLFFEMQNPHPGKLNIIIMSASYIGQDDGIEYVANNTPFDSGEITLQ